MKQIWLSVHVNSFLLVMGMGGKVMRAFGLVLVLFVLSIFGCGEGDGDTNFDIQPVDITGKWVGTFTSRDNFTNYTVYIDITSQNGSNGEGTWSRDDQVATRPYGLVRAQGYSRDGTPIASFYLYTEDEISCCSYLGCLERLSAKFDMGGLLMNETVVDNDAYGSAGCSADDGTMTVERVELY